MPVIKADAYGHGLLHVASTLTSCGACQYAVGTVDEGQELRNAGHQEKIICLLPPYTKDEWLIASQLNLTPLVGSFEALKQAASVCNAQRPLSIAIKLETGMHRLGFRKEELSELIDTLRTTPTVIPKLALSHFACSDMPEQDKYTKKQYDLFSSLTDCLKAEFPRLKRSLLNSSGTLALSEAPFEISRPGITLYGGNPFKGTTKHALGDDFEWVMSLSAPVLQVTKLKGGESVSYGRTFTASKDMKLAVISAGYATGVPRLLSNKLQVLLHGRRVPQVGRICMSMMMLDVTELPETVAGDTAWLLGGENNLTGQMPITPQDWADALDTISYEILCNVGGLNKRVYDN